jgi:hypothetical protein
MGKPLKCVIYKNNKVLGTTIHLSLMIHDINKHRVYSSLLITAIIKTIAQVQFLLNESLKGHQIRLNVRMEYVDTIFFIFLIALY